MGSIRTYPKHDKHDFFGTGLFFLGMVDPESMQVYVAVRPDRPESTWSVWVLYSRTVNELVQVTMVFVGWKLLQEP